MNDTRDSGPFGRAGLLLFLLVGAGPWLVAVGYLGGSGPSSTLVMMVPVVLGLLLVGLKLRSVLFAPGKARERRPAIR
jgi:hypothetical protein